MPSIALPCLEKQALLKSYQEAMLAYSKAVTELGQAIGAMVWSEYERVMRRTALARTHCEEARNRMDEHALHHRCGSQIG